MARHLLAQPRGCRIAHRGGKTPGRVTGARKSAAFGSGKGSPAESHVSFRSLGEGIGPRSPPILSAPLRDPFQKLLRLAPRERMRGVAVKNFGAFHERLR